MSRAPVTCYACDAPKVSREHVPPQCLFPEQNDLTSGKNLRKNLILVPSCDEHNLKKATDDEFLMWVLAVQSLGNQYRELSFHTKAIRAFRERPGSLFALLEKPKPINLLALDGQLVPTALVEIDFSRFKRCMTQIARALYFEETRAKWRADCDVYSNLFQAMSGTGSEGLNESHHHVIELAENAMSSLHSKGQNPEVFSYRFSSMRTDLTVLLMTFYEEIKVLVKYRTDT